MLKSTIQIFLFCLLTNMQMIECISETSCYCLQSNKRTIDDWMKKHWSYWMFRVYDEKSELYHFWIRSKNLSDAVIKDPLYYHDYHHNLMIYNQSLLLGIDRYTEKLIDLETRLKRPCPSAREETKLEIEGFEKGINKNFILSDKIRDKFKTCYKQCSERGHNQVTHFYDRAFVEFMEGNSANAVEFAEEYVKQYQEVNNGKIVAPEQLLLLGQFYIELNQFAKAIEFLSESLEIDSSNKAANFYRATAYFETGEFDKALKDYLSSNSIEEMNKSVAKASIEFTEGIANGLKRGVEEAAIDFVPSLCNSAYGIGEALWTSVQHPFEATKNFASACNEISTNAYEYCKNLDWDKIDGYAYEFKSLCDNFMLLNETSKGEQIGYIIGKYGTEIYAGKMACKGMAAYRDLKIANRVCNLEAMSISNINKEAIISSALKHATDRENYFQKIKIHWDRQNKHIPGKHNYIDGIGRIDICEIDLEKLIKSKAGTGQKIIGEMGIPGYKERVNFEQIIGQYAIEIKGQPTQYVPTSKGIIIHSKDGVHIVPSNPNGIIE